ncbi:phage/plasmid replication protein [Pseudomonas sp. WHRI 8822A]|uniref:phage/plasmid replication domain-containing protein n=1 Tax=Pseudomonas sp. WHRI 8822A TaxID=3162568 RepID=UPI0032EF0196
MKSRSFSEIRAALQASGLTNIYALNTTSAYALRWAAGEKFDQAKSSFKVHRARLRKVGIDIALDYDGSIDTRL